MGAYRSSVPASRPEVPTALALVFDTSLSMSYKENGKTRLDEAKERARAILEKIQDSSLVFVVDSSQPQDEVRDELKRIVAEW